MKVVYIAGPFRAANSWLVEQNIRRAEELALRVAEAGAMPLCPHCNTRFFNGTLTDEFWLAGTMALLERCDAIVLTDRWPASSGCRSERARAVELGIPIFYDTDAVGWLPFVEWCNRP